jgi:hypothetical protein
LIESTEKKETFVLAEGFKQNSSQHNALESLGERYLIQVPEDGSWDTGKIVELTPIAQKILDDIKAEIHYERPKL